MTLMKLLALVFVFASTLQGQSFSASPDLDRAVEQAVALKKLPGAVLLVGHNGQIIHRKAYGQRALLPQPEKMTVDTVFDIASLTKIVATTSSMMKLVEQGKVRIDEKVTEYLPEFQNGKSDITVRNLLTHFSGLRPDLDLEPEWSGYGTGIERALHDPPAALPGVKFVYSDINFILLGEMVRRLSGESLPAFANETVFAPLGMRETMFQPPATLRSRIAPTEQLKTGEILRGTVHDPTARFMGGIAGHAGLFSTADDLAKFCQMMLDQGLAGNTRLFSPLTISRFTAVQSPATQRVQRGLGWDIDSPLSGNRGELFPLGSFGHTGFTGTSIWLDPASSTYVVLLANSVHPARIKAITPLRSAVATIVAAAVGQASQMHPVLTGLDILETNNFGILQGKRVGLITNQTGVDRQRRRNVDRMLASGVQLTALFSPEHGFFGVEDKEIVAGTKDAVTGIPVFSLYEGKNRRPSKEMLRNVDVLVFDIADIGARFYTYISTMAYAMEEAAKAHIPFIVLDRPNPITGLHMEGPVLDRTEMSFIGYYSLPLRHGMTAGELAKLFNAENKINAALTVVPAENWRRSDWFDTTGLPWVDPSPNIRSLTAALLYPGVAMLEASTNYSVGRGTDAPFELVGAEFIRGPELADYLNKRGIPGVRMYPVQFRPTSSNLNGKLVDGIRLVVTNRDLFDATRLGVEIACALQKLYPGKIDFSKDQKLIGSVAVVQGMRTGQDAGAILRAQVPPLERFNALREKYLIYR